MANKLTILQHNVAHWKAYIYILLNTYREINPHLILINSHGLKSEEILKIYGCTSHKVNTSNELHDGSAILIKSDIKTQNHR